MYPRALVLAAVAISAIGCGRQPYRIAPVSGRVMLDGKPLANATVQFYPLAAATSENAGPTALGRTDEEGRYVLVPFDRSAAKGAVVGQNKVMITVHPKE